MHLNTLLFSSLLALTSVVAAPNRRAATTSSSIVTSVPVPDATTTIIDIFPTDDVTSVPVPDATTTIIDIFPTDNVTTSTTVAQPAPTNNGTGDVIITPPGSTQIFFRGIKNKCLDVKGNEQVNGTPVQVYDCNGTGAQRWKMSTWSGSTKIQLDGTNYCLDAGSPIGNNVGLKIWQCYDGLPQQQFYITGDNRIAVEGKGQCLDQPNGNDAAGTQTQTYQCTTGNTNQVWTVGFYYV